MRRRAAPLTLCIVVGGCLSAPRGTERPPDDFAISISTAGPPSGTFAPGWYMVEADGALRAATGVRSPRSAAPPPVRLLTRSQVDEVWSMARAAGLTDSLAAPAAEGDCEIELASGGRRRAFVVDSGSNPELTRLVQRLREFAWVSDEPSP